MDDPEAHGVKFNGDREEILMRTRAQSHRVNGIALTLILMPTSKKRFEKIIVSLIDGGFTLGLGH